MDDLRYPIGDFKYAGSLTESDRKACIGRIAAAPSSLRAAVHGLSDTQLDTPYRPGGWTVRQVVHHVPDSHLNAYTRFRLALTETSPTIRPYDEVRWAELPDARSGPIGISLGLLDALHARWVLLLRQLNSGDWARTYTHPEHRRELTLDEMLAMYAWHGEHHVAHITSLRGRMQWN
ncbi:MAG: YfiT family bacillithiol transferase [Gemmatimonadales bacterium]